MKPEPRIRAVSANFICSGVTVVFLLAPFLLAAQQKQLDVRQTQNATYQLSRETVLTGTVVSFAQGTGGDLAGAHLMINAGSGVVDAHVGNAKLLSLNHLTFAAGDAVRLTGEDISTGASSVFAVRIVQKGSQSLNVRSVRGFVLQPVRGNTPTPANSEGGVL
jgi:hypothetical protein